MADESDLIQKNYFLEEIVKNEIIALCYENNLGFLIGKLGSGKSALLFAIMNEMENIF